MTRNWLSERSGRGAFRSNRIVAIAVVLTMSLGISASTLVFALIDTYFLRPLPFYKANRLVSLSETTHDKEDIPVSYDNFRDWRQQAASFESMAMYRGASYIVASSRQSSSSGSQRVPGMQVAVGLFRTLGETPLIGRDFTDDEDRVGGNLAVIISNRFWQEDLNGSPDSLGSTIMVNGTAHVIVGILRPSFRFFDNADLFVPLCGQCVSGRGTHVSTNVIARLKDGVSITDAEAQLQTIASRLEREYPDTNAGHGARVMGLRDSVVADLKPVVFALTSVVILVLLMSCTNASNLLLLRQSALERNWAIRIALGASTGSLMRRFIGETVLLSSLSGGISLALAFCVLRGLRVTLGQQYSSICGSPEVDVRVAVFTAAVCAATGIAISFFPVRQLRGVDLADMLRTAGSGTGTAKHRHLLRNLLVALEVAFSLVLLTSCGLVIRSLYRLLNVDPGYRAEHVLTLQLAQPPNTFLSADERRAHVVSLLQSLRTVPGVISASMGTPLPLDLSDTSMSHFAVAGRPIPPPGDRPLIDVVYVTPEYFSVLQMQLLEGRYFTDSDREGAPVAIVNHTLARKYWPDGSLNASFFLNSIPGPSQKVVGVVQDTKSLFYGGSVRPMIYVPYYGPWDLLIRVHGDPFKMAPAVRRKIQQTEPSWAIYDLKSLEQRIAESTSQPRLAAWLLSISSCVALALAGIGIYGTVAYSLRLRTREIAIRVALGATSRNVWMLVAKLMAPAALGALAGLAGTILFTRVLSSLLIDVQVSDPITFGCAFAFELIIGVVACYLPGRRGLKINPAVALKSE